MLLETLRASLLGMLVGKCMIRTRNGACRVGQDF